MACCSSCDVGGVCEAVEKGQTSLNHFDIEKRTIENTDFRRVLHTGPRNQLVVMSIQPHDDIGEEVHKDTDQFIRVESGTGKAIIDGKTTPLMDGSAVTVDAGLKHNIINTGSTPLKVYTIYSPPHHPDGTVHKTKSDASETVSKNGDMLQYFQDHPDKLKERQERMRKKADVKKARKLARRMKFRGMDLSIETDKGQLRHWGDPHGDGEKGTTKMEYPYGYIRRTMGNDDEHVDVYVGPNESVDEVYIVHQMKKPNFKHYDEDKVMIGFESPKDAKQAYLAHYNDSRFFGSMKTMKVDDFKEEFVNKNLESLSSPPSPEMMGPPPIDVETLEGVTSLLGRLGSIKDDEMMQVMAEVWGPGFESTSELPQIREEVTGFLLDQRDLLMAVPMQQQPQQMSAPPLNQTDHTLLSRGPS